MPPPSASDHRARTLPLRYLVGETVVVTLTLLFLLFSASERCTKSVLLKVHSLRQLGKEKLTFGESHDPNDLSYVDFKVRSVIMGEDSINLKVRGKQGSRRRMSEACRNVRVCRGPSSNELHRCLSGSSPMAGLGSSFVVSDSSYRVRTSSSDYFARVSPRRSNQRPEASNTHHILPLLQQEAITSATSTGDVNLNTHLEKPLAILGWWWWWWLLQRRPGDDERAHVGQGDCRRNRRKERGRRRG